LLRGHCLLEDARLVPASLCESDGVHERGRDLLVRYRDRVRPQGLLGVFAPR
jgi:hypothetical protein